MTKMVLCALALVLSSQTTFAAPTGDDVEIRDHKNYPSNIPDRDSTNGTPQKLPSDGKDQPAPQTQPLAGVQINIQPVFFIDCSKHDYSMLNQLTNVQKISEDAATAQFTFNSWLVACKDSQIAVRKYDQSKVHVGMFKSGIFGGLEKGSYKISWIVEGDSTRVTLAFDKAKMFPQGVTERKLVMTFYPWGPFVAWGAQQRYFVWKVKLTKYPDQSVNLSFF